MVQSVVKFTLIVLWLICAHLTSFGTLFYWLNEKCRFKSTDAFNVFLFNAVISIDCDLEPKNNDARLKKSLLCKYDKTAHPSNNNEAVNITIKMIVKGFLFVRLVNA